MLGERAAIRLIRIKAGKPFGTPQRVPVSLSGRHRRAMRAPVVRPNCCAPYARGVRDIPRFVGAGVPRITGPMPAAIQTA